VCELSVLTAEPPVPVTDWRRDLIGASHRDVLDPEVARRSRALVTPDAALGLQRNGCALAAMRLHETEVAAIQPLLDDRVFVLVHGEDGHTHWFPRCSLVRAALTPCIYRRPRVSHGTVAG
jgi:hypothetical protein